MVQMVLKQWRVKFAVGPELMLWAKDGEDLRLLRIGGVKSITPTGARARERDMARACRNRK